MCDAVQVIQTEVFRMPERLPGFATLLAMWLLVSGALSGCTTANYNTPSNQALLHSDISAKTPQRNIAGENLIALSFSGGGLRAAAFSFGVLKGLQASSTADLDLLDDVTMISSVSGGSLTAAYYGLHGKESMGSFREKVLLRDMEANMRLSAFAPNNLVRLFTGGLNDRSTLSNWLDAEVFDHASFADLYARRKPDVWINASDLYHRTAFPFIPPMFHALCSDLSKFSVAEAVSASMAVPLVFSPIVLKAYPENCPNATDGWVTRALADRSSPKSVQAAATALQAYRDPKRVNYVKLVDGGVTDNYGLSSILLGRAVSRTSYGPLTARDALSLRRMLFLVVDAGRAPSGEWALTMEGPSGVDAALAATDSAIDSAARVGFDLFKKVMSEWQTSVIDFRCGLSESEVVRLRGSLVDWNCQDVQFHFGMVSFADLGKTREADLNAIPTRLSLPAPAIDTAIQAGMDATLESGTLRRYLASLRRAPH